MKHLLLIAIAGILSLACEAQIKIGDITISDSLAKEYFFDCYKHPDTVFNNPWIKDTFYLNEVIGKLDTIGGSRNSHRIIKRYPNGTVKLRADTILPRYETNPRTPSASDFAAFMRRKYNKP